MASTARSDDNDVAHLSSHTGYNKYESDIEEAVTSEKTSLLAGNSQEREREREREGLQPHQQAERNVGREVFVAFICFVCYGMSYYPLVLSAQLPVPVIWFYYGICHLGVSFCLEFHPAVKVWGTVYESLTANPTGTLWIFITAAMGSIQRTVLILILIVDSEASVWVPLSALSMLVGFAYSLIVMDETLSGYRLTGVTSLIFANALIIVDKLHRSPLHGMEWEAYFFLGIRVIALGMIQPAVKETSKRGVSFGISFQVGNVFGALLDFLFAFMYASFQGKWDLYYDNLGSWMIIFPGLGVLLRAFGRLFLRMLAEQQDSVVLVSIVALSSHIPVLLFLLLRNEPITTLKIAGLLLGIPAIILITVTLKPGEGDPRQKSSTTTKSV